MKKILAFVVVLAMLALSLCSCEKVTCSICENEVSKSDANISEILGQEIVICDDCASIDISID